MEDAVGLNNPIGLALGIPGVRSPAKVHTLTSHHHEVSEIYEKLAYNSSHRHVAKTKMSFWMNESDVIQM